MKITIDDNEEVGLSIADAIAKGGLFKSTDKEYCLIVGHVHRAADSVILGVDGKYVYPMNQESNSYSATFTKRRWEPIKAITIEN